MKVMIISVTLNEKTFEGVGGGGHQTECRKIFAFGKMIIRREADRKISRYFCIASQDC